MAGPTVSLLELRDEFAFVRNDALYADVARCLAPNSVKVVLVRGKGNKGIAGAISETHFLRVCASGIDPARTFARDKMQTDLLRLRDDTPLDDAVEIIDERDPDAVLILKPGNKFAGYLSPQDFRELELAQERVGGGRDQGPSSPPPVKTDVSHSLDLGDEFAFVRNDAMFSDASRMLAPEHVKVILVRAKKDKGIAGVLTEPEFLKVCSTGINPNKTLVNKHMLTDILRIRSDTPLKEAVKIIEEKDPDAVLVLSDENKFVGYLSPADYNEALELLKKKKVEVFDVPLIIPELPPPPPPPPPPTPPVSPVIAPMPVPISPPVEVAVLPARTKLELRPTAFTPVPEIYSLHNISLNTDREVVGEDIITITEHELAVHIGYVLGGEELEPVVWEELGSEVLVHADSVAVRLDDGYFWFTVDLECDQTGREPIVIPFYIGTSTKLTNLKATSEEVVHGHPILVGRWGDDLQDAVWLALLDKVAMLCEELNENIPEHNVEPAAFGADDGKLWVRMQDETDLLSPQTRMAAPLRHHITRVGVRRTPVAGQQVSRGRSRGG